MASTCRPSTGDAFTMSAGDRSHLVSVIWGKMSKEIVLTEHLHGQWLLEESWRVGKIYCCAAEEFVGPTIVKVKLFIRDGCVLVAVLDPLQKLGTACREHRGTGTLLILTIIAKFGLISRVFHM